MPTVNTGSRTVRMMIRNQRKLHPSLEIDLRAPCLNRTDLPFTQEVEDGTSRNLPIMAPGSQSLTPKSDPNMQDLPFQSNISIMQFPHFLCHLALIMGLHSISGFSRVSILGVIKETCVEHWCEQLRGCVSTSDLQTNEPSACEQRQ